MRAPTRTDSHFGRSVVAPLCALMLAVSGLWASSAGASRGPKESCSSGGRARDGLGHRQHSAVTVPVAANSGGGDCRDRESSGAASQASDAPEPGGTESRYERPAAGSPPSSRPSGSPPAQRSGTTRTYSDPSGRSPRPSDKGASKAGDGSSPGSSGAGANGGGASLQVPPDGLSGQPGGGGSPSGASSGGRKSPRRPSGGAGRGSGGGRGSAGAGSGGNHSRPGGGYGPEPGGSAGGLPGFRVAPAIPPSSRTRSGAAGGPGMAWAAFRAPGAALPSQMVPPAVVLPSTAAAVLGASTAPTAALVQAGPIPRTGGEISASAVLALILILVGGTMRRTARLSRR